MGYISRRGLIGNAAGAVAGSVAGAATSVAGTTTAFAEPNVPASNPQTQSQIGPVTVRPDDGRYPDVIRGTNQRFVGQPEYVVLAGNTQQVVDAVQSAVDTGRRIQVRSGGHCYEGFVYNSKVDVVIDMSLMTSVYYDSVRNGYVVEPGAENYDVYERLYKGWGVTLPAGSCAHVGAGGHIVGGGYGLLSRLHGLTVDYVYAVEVVVVDRYGTARAVIATSDLYDRHHDLWWAHTGGGGGTFGIVTRYWLRDLPKAPSTVLVHATAWKWDTLREAGFTQLMRNWGEWHEQNSAPNSPYAGLFGLLKLNKRNDANSEIGLLTQMDATRSDAKALYDRYIQALNAGLPTGAEMVPQTQPMGEHRPMPEYAEPTTLPWFLATWKLSGGPDPSLKFKNKSAYHKKRYSDAQVAALYRHLTRSDYQNPQMLVQIDSYGGWINSVAPDVTAVPQRDSIMKAQFQVYWDQNLPDAKHLQFIRELYRDTFADTGGVPVPNDVTDGCYINYPDVDLSSSTWNTSGVRWSTLYWKDNYARLRRVKTAYDPLNIFRHAQSVKLATRATPED